MAHNLHNTPVVARSSVPKRHDYSDYRDELRFDFYYSCAYCSITEIEASGIGFEIEHYLPRKFFPLLKDVYDNLMWSCKKCNGRKSDFCPTEDDKRNGFFVIRPDEDDPRVHLQVKNIDDLFLEHKTKTGEFNIHLLDLNRQDLRRLRAIRKKMWISQDYIAYGISEILQVNIDQLPSSLKL